MKKPTRLALLSSLLILVIAVAIGATATVSPPGAVSAQDDGGPYPSYRVENVRAVGKANQITITWSPPRAAKETTVGTGDDAKTYPRVNGVSKYVLWFGNNPPRDVPVSTQGVDVSTTVTGLEPGRGYNFNIQTCFNNDGWLSGCYVPEGHRTAYTAPGKPALLSVSRAHGNSISLSWVGSNALDVAPFDRYDRFECSRRVVVPPPDTVPWASCGLANDQAKTVTMSLLDEGKVYEFRVRHKARSYTETISHGNFGDYAVKVSYDPGPWRTVTVGGRPKAPTNVRITATTPDSVTLAWNPVTQTTGGGTVMGDVSYLVAYIYESFYDCPDPNEPGQTLRCFDGESGWGASTTETSATVRNLDPNKTYKFSVLSKAGRRIGESTAWVAESPAPRTMGTPGQGSPQPSPAQKKATITVTAADPVMVNEGGSATYTVSLDVQPTANVVVQTASDNGDVTTQPASLTFTPDNWQTAQTVSVNAAHDDDAADDDATISNSVSGDDEYARIGPSVNVAVTDDDTAGVTVSKTELTLEEGGTATYTVVLDAQPIGDFVFISPFTYVEGLTAQPSQLTFTPANWRTPQTVTVSAAQDDDAADEETGINHFIGAFAGTPYSYVTVPGVSVTVTDDDAAGQPGEADPPGELGQAEPENNAPAADAGPDRTVDAGDAVSLDGSGSNDPDGDALTYAWTQTSGPSVTLSGASSATPSFTAPNADATLVFSLTVNDGTAASAADTVAVTVVVPDPQREALEAFYQATGGHSWTSNGNWLSDKPLGQWHGVTVNGQGQVTHLSLRNNGLSGSLPAALGNLEALQVLSLDRNSIGGSLPTQLGNLSNLTRLAMNRNSLSGSIPSQLGNLSNLSIIGLARNSLSGALPTSLGNLSGLTKLSLHDNTALSGALPSGFTGMANLQRLAIANTGLCAPDDEAFSDWLDTVPNKPDGVETCE